MSFTKILTEFLYFCIKILLEYFLYCKPKKDDLKETSLLLKNTFRNQKQYTKGN